MQSNELLFYNSLKMKMSVTLGVTQMLLGLLLKGWNALHFEQRLDFLWEFVPQLVFACSLFGYLIVMIFAKWSIDWNERMGLDKGAAAGGCPLRYGGSGQGCQPPSLIATLIDMVLKPGVVHDPMYAGQAAMQGTLLTAALISVPAMLLVKPLLLKRQHDSNPYQQVGSLDDDEEDDESGKGHGGGGGGGGGGGHGHGPFNFAELMIHQGIETIEFVLGMVSNTASYLRLWALSLAHSQVSSAALLALTSFAAAGAAAAAAAAAAPPSFSRARAADDIAVSRAASVLPSRAPPRSTPRAPQLAKVFWEKIMVPAISSNNPAAIVVGFSVFAAVTTGVLLCMDVLECYLHALRLHWVEFQNKFYGADGHKFQPFFFETLLADVEE